MGCSKIADYDENDQKGISFVLYFFKVFGENSMQSWLAVTTYCLMYDSTRTMGHILVIVNFVAGLGGFKYLPGYFDNMLQLVRSQCCRCRLFEYGWRLVQFVFCSVCFQFFSTLGALSALCWLGLAPPPTCTMFTSGRATLRCHTCYKILAHQCSYIESM